MGNDFSRVQLCCWSIAEAAAFTGVFEERTRRSTASLRPIYSDFSSLAQIMRTAVRKTKGWGVANGPGNTNAVTSADGKREDNNVARPPPATELASGHARSASSRALTARVRCPLTAHSGPPVTPSQESDTEHRVPTPTCPPSR
ncbi:hypothetical protein AAFF_G00166950 [Aldrovandia affinis]|uniref:Uncharacterized protein n=1 Tax=Aldrovandia affinis TaxID=143900 RepID=A0AAD7RLY7_9TELE|nr:hypothetical protein AAFF_G00166950 [Aldrovandia affinis]